MFFFSRFELDRWIRMYRDSSGVSDELRGWNWSSDLLSPIIDNLYLSVSEVANRYCETYRDIYLKRVLKKPAPVSFKTVRGWVYHRISSDTLTLVKSYLYNSGFVPGYKLYNDLARRGRRFINRVMRSLNVSKYVSDEEFKKLYNDSKTLYKYLILQAASYNDQVLSREAVASIDSLANKVVPSVVERVIDGSPLGLSKQLRIDMFLDNNIVIDIKTGDYRDFHKYTLAGYALAVEADLNKPVDYGIITYLHIQGDFVKVRNDFYLIDDTLRREFIELRDHAMDIIHLSRDPGRPTRCPSYCIYYNVCNPLG